MKYSDKMVQVWVKRTVKAGAQEAVHTDVRTTHGIVLRKTSVEAGQQGGRLGGVSAAQRRRQTDERNPGRPCHTDVFRRGAAKGGERFQVCHHRQRPRIVQAARQCGGIAAEVLTVPHSAIGRMIYESKLYLQTTDLFAWTLAVILLSLGLERLVLRALTPRGKGGVGT